jgi:hypothetical protein
MVGAQVKHACVYDRRTLFQLSLTIFTKSHKRLKPCFLTRFFRAECSD